MKRNYYLLAVEEWTKEELIAEIDGFKQLGGVGVKDIIRKNESEDELQWRCDKGYSDDTPQEIEDNLFEQGKIKKRYIKNEITLHSTGI